MLPAPDARSWMSTARAVPVVVMVPLYVIAAVPPVFAVPAPSPTRNAGPVEPLSAPLPRFTVPANPLSFTLFVPPLATVDVRVTLTDGGEGVVPVKSSAAPDVLLIDTLLTLSVPTLAPTIALPFVAWMLKPWSVLADARVTALPAPLPMAGAAPAEKRLMLLTVSA